MATVLRQSDNDWEVNMASPRSSTVRVVINMTPATARRLADFETRRLATLNPNRNIPSEPVGSAVMNVLSMYAAHGRAG